MSIIMIVLLVLLGLVWLGIGVLQLGFGLSHNASDQSGNLIAYGVWNVIAAVVNVWSINDVLHHYRRAVKDLGFLAIAGSLFGLAQIVLIGAWVQAIVVPLYVVLGVLAFVNRDQFTEQSQRQRTGRVGRFIAWRSPLKTLIVGCAAIVLIVAAALAAALVQQLLKIASSSSPQAAGAGTHVCAKTHFDRHNVICQQDDGTITASQFGDAWLNVTGKDGNQFTSTSLTVILSKQDSGGGWSEQGRSTAGASLSDSTMAWPLTSVFVSATTQPENGSAYRIEVDEGSTSLGTATFAYKG